MCIKGDKEKESKDSFFDGRRGITSRGQEKAAAQAPIERSRAKTGGASHWLSAFALQFFLMKISCSPV